MVIHSSPTTMRLGDECPDLVFRVTQHCELPMQRHHPVVDPCTEEGSMCKSQGCIEGTVELGEPSALLDSEANISGTENKPSPAERLDKECSVITLLDDVHLSQVYSY